MTIGATMASRRNLKWSVVNGRDKGFVNIGHVAGVRNLPQHAPPPVFPFTRELNDSEFRREGKYWLIFF